MMAVHIIQVLCRINWKLNDSVAMFCDASEEKWVKSNAIKQKEKMHGDFGGGSLLCVVYVRHTSW